MLQRSNTCDPRQARSRRCCRTGGEARLCRSAAVLRAQDGWPDPELARLTGGNADLDDFSACKITRKEDWVHLYAKPFYFGCEADDRTDAWAFGRQPFGARLNAIYSSDIGHGNGGMTNTEYRSILVLAILAALLIAGNDLRNMTPEIHDILTNKEVIAVDQDAMGREGRRSGQGWRPGGVGEADAGRRAGGGPAQSRKFVARYFRYLGRYRVSQSPGRRRSEICGRIKIWGNSTGNFQRRWKVTEW